MDSYLLQRFIALVGESHAACEREKVAPYLVEKRGLWKGAASLVLKPADVVQVSSILRLANETKTPIVPQGGNTGLVGGQIPDQSGNAIILSLERLDHIHEIDVISNSITTQAGVVLEKLHQVSDEHDRLFPLNLASRGSCQIGGNLSSNAGGINVLSYGCARDLCLGLEVVLPTGEIFDDLRKLKKDNTGYDLKNLFIGAEGTLGVITAAVLKLFPKPKAKSTAWVCLSSVEQALLVLESATKKLGNALCAFELLNAVSVSFVQKHFPNLSLPKPFDYPWYVLMDVCSFHSQKDAQEKMEDLLALCFQKGTIQEGFVAANVSQATLFWRLRESLSCAQNYEGVSIKHDISVPIAAIPEFIHRSEMAIEKLSASSPIVCFGHMGDGSLHYNVMQPRDQSPSSFRAFANSLRFAIHDIVCSLGGSISAEHGIGQMKRDELLVTASSLEIDLMHRIKQAFDPSHIMNPGKVL